MAFKIPPYKCLRDFVMMRAVTTKEINGIAIPETSKSGVVFHIIAVGNDVKQARVGDITIPIGEIGQDIVRSPYDQAIFWTKEANIIVILDHTNEYDPPEELSPAEKVGI